MYEINLNSCRICLKEDGEKSIFDKYNDTTYADVIMDLASAKVDITTNLANFLCFECSKKVESTITLRYEIDIANNRLYAINDNCFETTEDVKSDIKPEISFSIDIPLENSVDFEPNITENIDVEIKDEYDNETNFEPDNSSSVDEDDCSEHENEENAKLTKTIKRRAKKKLLKIKKERTDPKDTTCGECGKKFRNTSTLFIHSFTHSGEKPFECDVCHKKFSYKPRLNTHKKIHTDEKIFICEICSKQFTTYIYLKQHKETHLPDSERRFKCDKCEKTFQVKRHFKSHLKLHDRVKDVICGECGKAFNSVYNLNRHNNTVHLVIKNHVCSACGKAFSNSGNLVAHFRIHTGEKPYHCKYCDSSFNQSTPLVRHTQQHIARGDQMKTLN